MEAATDVDSLGQAWEDIFNQELERKGSEWYTLVKLLRHARGAKEGELTFGNRTAFLVYAPPETAGSEYTLGWEDIKVHFFPPASIHKEMELYSTENEILYLKALQEVDLCTESKMNVNKRYAINSVRASVESKVLSPPLSSSHYLTFQASPKDFLV